MRDPGMLFSCRTVASKNMDTYALLPVLLVFPLFESAMFPLRIESTFQLNYSAWDLKRLVSLVFICIMLTVTLGCHKESEQDKVKKIIINLQKAAEDKDIKKIINSLSKTYYDTQGNNYESIKGVVLAYFYRYPKILVYIPSLDVSVEDAYAKATFQAVLTSRGAAESVPAILPESLGMYAFDMSFKKESGEWKVVSAKWERKDDVKIPNTRK